MPKPSDYCNLPNSVKKLLRYNAWTPDEESMPGIYAKMKVEDLLKQVSKLRKKRVKQLNVLDELIELINK